VIRLRSLLSDVVGVIGRLGVAGAILIAAVFVFGVLAGAVVVNRLQEFPTASVFEQGDKADAADKEGQDKAQAKKKHPNNGHGQGQGNKAATEKETPEND
jgi:hypothetical protein